MYHFPFTNRHPIQNIYNGEMCSVIDVHFPVLWFQMSSLIWHLCFWQNTISYNYLWSIRKEKERLISNRTDGKDEVTPWVISSKELGYCGNKTRLKPPKDIDFPIKVLMFFMRISKIYDAFLVMFVHDRSGTIFKP